jgi:hypothetical protein
VLLVFLGGCFSAGRRISPQRLTIDAEPHELVDFYTGVDCAVVAGWASGRLGMQSSCEPVFSSFTMNIERPDSIMMDQSLGIYAVLPTDPSSIRLAYLDSSGEVSDNVWSFDEEVRDVRLIRRTNGTSIEWRSTERGLCHARVRRNQEGVILGVPYECEDVDRLGMRGSLHTNFEDNSAVVESGSLFRSHPQMSLAGVGVECGLALFGSEVHLGCPSSENDGMWDWTVYRGDSEVVFESSKGRFQWHEAGDIGFAVMKGRQFSGHPAAGCSATSIPKRWSLLDVDFVSGACPIGLFESPGGRLYLVDTRRSVEDSRELRDWRRQCWEDGQCPDPPFRR